MTIWSLCGTISPAEWYEVSWYDIVVVRSLRNSLENTVLFTESLTISWLSVCSCPLLISCDDNYSCISTGTFYLKSVLFVCSKLYLIYSDFCFMSCQHMHNGGCLDHPLFCILFISGKFLWERSYTCRQRHGGIRIRY